MRAKATVIAAHGYILGLVVAGLVIPETRGFTLTITVVVLAVASVSRLATFWLEGE